MRTRPVHVPLARQRESGDAAPDARSHQLFGVVVDLFRSRAALEAEVLVLRQQIMILRRRKPTRLSFIAADRLVLGWLYRLLPVLPSPSYDRRPWCAGI